MEIASNYNDGGAAFELAKFINDWEKQVEELKTPSILAAVMPNSSHCPFDFSIVAKKRSQAKRMAKKTQRPPEWQTLAQLEKKRSEINPT